MVDIEINKNTPTSIVAKVCGTCKERKPLSEFGNQKNGKFGKRGSCKVCKNKESKEWGIKNPGRRAELAKKWRIENPEKYKEKTLQYRGTNKQKKAASKYYHSHKEKEDNYTKQWRKNNPEKWSRIQKNAQLKRLYNISIEDYESMLINQNFKCKICNTDKPGGRGSFHVDHCHSTQEIRGLLCHSCNIALGTAEDSIFILNNAITYLELYNEKN